MKRQVNVSCRNDRLYCASISIKHFKSPYPLSTGSENNYRIMSISGDSFSDTDSKISGKISSNSQDKTKKIYAQKFRQNWLTIFQPWLGRDPNNSNKPYCKVCKCPLHCNICHFKRHSRTVKHKAHLEAAINGGDVMTLKQKLGKGSRTMKKERKTLNSNRVKKEIEIDENVNIANESVEERVNSTSLDRDNTSQLTSSKTDEYSFEKKLNKTMSNDLLSNTNVPPDPNRSVSLSKSPTAKERAILLNRIKRDRIDLFDSYAAVVSHRANDIGAPIKEKDHVDLYFDSVSASIKRLSPKLIAEAKIRVSQMVGELELREITAKESASRAGQTNVESPFSITAVPNPAPYYISHQPTVVYVENNHENEAVNEQTTALYTPSSS